MQNLDVEEKTNIAMSFSQVLGITDMNTNEYRHTHMDAETCECSTQRWMCDLDVEEGNNAPVPFAVFGDHWGLRPLFRDAVCSKGRGTYTHAYT